MQRFLLLFALLLCSFGCVSKKESSIKLVDKKPLLLREPYLQNVNTNSCIITWKTDKLSNECSVVFYKDSKGKKEKIKGFLTNHEGNKFNEVQLTNLKPDTKYFYEIYSNGYLLAKGDNYFLKTSPKKKNKRFSFYALGDIGADVKWSFAKEPANRISELKIKPDFGLGLGDIVYPKGESKNYDNQLFAPFQEVFKNTPFYPVPGNHDWLSDPDKNFEKEWALPNNEHYYSFSYANSLFIGLDSSDGGFYDKANQLKWLKKTLEENKNNFNWIIVFLHHNGKTCTYKPNYEHVISFYDVFAKNNVDLVLNGHAHTYERLKPYDYKGEIDKTIVNDTLYKNLTNRFVSITIGAGGKINKKWKVDVNDPKNCEDGSIVAVAKHVPSFATITIDKNELTLKAINSLTGNVFDTFSIKK